MVDGSSAIQRPLPFYTDLHQRPTA